MGPAADGCGRGRESPVTTGGLIAMIGMAEGKQTRREWISTASTYDQTISVRLPTSLSEISVHGGLPPLTQKAGSPA